IVRLSFPLPRRPPPAPPLFPYTTLFRSSTSTGAAGADAAGGGAGAAACGGADASSCAGTVPSTSPLRLRAARSPSLIWSGTNVRSEEHTSELQSLRHLVCRLLLEKKKSC